MQTNQTPMKPARPSRRKLWTTLAVLVIFAQCCICILPVWGYSSYMRQVAGSSFDDSGLQVCAWAGSRVVNFDFSQRITVKEAVPLEVVFGSLGVGVFDVCERLASGQ